LKRSVDAQERLKSKKRASVGVARGATGAGRSSRTKRGCGHNHGIDWDAQPLGLVRDIALAKKLGVTPSSVRRARARRGICRKLCPHSKTASRCSDCKRERARRWRAENPVAAAALETRRRYRARNAEKINEQKKRWQWRQNYGEAWAVLYALREQIKKKGWKVR
jgi:hypothetical protein